MQDKTQGALPDIQHSVEISAPIRKVWDLITTSEGIATWFMPNDFRPVVGHAFFLQTPFGPVPCEVLELDPPNRLSFSWDKFGWRVIFELKEREGKTIFTVVHAGWGAPDEIVGRASETNLAVHQRMDDGWGHITRRLADMASEG